MKQNTKCIFLVTTKRVCYNVRIKQSLEIAGTRGMDEVHALCLFSRLREDFVILLYSGGVKWPLTKVK